MTQERTREWTDGTHREYHERQFERVYRSTVHFCDWAERLGFLGGQAERRILDVGAGLGANAAYMAERFPGTRVVGMDLSEELVAGGNEILRNRGIANAELIQGDLFALPAHFRGAFDGVVSYQVLSWLPDYRAALRALAALDVGWIAATSLFYEGDIDCTIQVRDYTTPASGQAFRDTYYNVYALPRVQALCAELGYPAFHRTRFEIDVDLAAPATGGMGTYTERLADGRRLQISGPLLMPWYFVLAARS